MAKVKRRARRRLGPNDFVQSGRALVGRRTTDNVAGKGPLSYNIPAGAHGFVRGIAPGTHPRERILAVEFEYGENAMVSVEAAEDDLALVV